MRSGEWHRTDRLLSCMPRDLQSPKSPEDEQKPGEDRAEAGLREALAGLQQAGLLQELGEDHGFEGAWGALGGCLLAEELRAVLFNMTRVKAKG